MKKKTPKAWTSQQDLVSQVEELRKQGMSIKEACAQIGANWTYYYSIKREMAGKNMIAADPVQIDGEIGDISFPEFVRLKREYERLRANRKQKGI